MIFKKETKWRALHGDAASFEAQMNELSHDLSEKGIDADFHMEMNPAAENPFAAIIQWEERHVIPESIADEKSLSGETSRCGSCPHFMQRDKRRKTGYCEFKNEQVNRHDSSCDHRYLTERLETELEIKDEDAPG